MLDGEAAIVAAGVQAATFAWALLIGGLHWASAAMLEAGEFAVRRWRFAGEHTGFWATMRGVRRQGSGR